MARIEANLEVHEQRLVLHLADEDLLQFLDGSKYFACRMTDVQMGDTPEGRRLIIDLTASLKKRN